MHRLFVTILLLISLVSTGIFVQTTKVSKSLHAASEPQYLPGEVVLKLKNDERYYKVSLSYDTDVMHTVDQFSENASVEVATPNYLYRLALVPNDALLYKQWYLGQVKTYLTWNKGTGSKDVVVAVIDSGVDIEHPDLKENIWVNTNEIFGDGIDNDHNGFVDDRNGWDFINKSNDPRPKDDYLLGQTADTKIGLIHGTVISGVIAAQGDNWQGIAGVTWSSKIMPLRVADAEGYVDGLSVIRAIDYAIANGASVINMSFGGINDNPFLDDAILRAYRAGIVVVASIGNQGGNGQQDLDVNPVYPACTLSDNAENVLLGVGATDTTDHLASFSHYGKKCVDLLAPGVNFYTAQAKFPQYGYTEYYGGPFSGTSVAAPVVAGAAALLKGLNPQWTNRQIMEALIRNADDIDDINPAYKGKLGGGRLNILASAGYDERNIFLQKTDFSADKLFVFTPEVQAKSRVNIMMSDWSKSEAFAAYPFVFRGGIRAVVGEVSGDGEDDIVTVPGDGGGPHVRVFDQTGRLESQFFAYESTFRGGLSVALVDVNGDGIKEIAVAPGPGYGKPLIRIYSFRGMLMQEITLQDFDSDPGINFVTGDIDADDATEIIVVPQIGRAQVSIYSLDGSLERRFDAYPSFYKGGAKVTIGDVNNDGYLDIITGTNKGGGPQVRIFSYTGRVISQFFADTISSRSGINIGILKVQGKDRILIGSPAEKEGFIRLVDVNGDRVRDPLFLGPEFDYGIRFGVSY